MAETSPSGSEVNEDENSTNIEDTTKLTDENGVISNLTTERSVFLEPYEDFCDNDLVIPRDTDRIMEQFILMLLRIGAHLTTQRTGPAQIYSPRAPGLLPNTLLLGEDTETPPSVGNDKRRNTSYLQQYPQIFMKRDSNRVRTSPSTSIDESNKNLKRSENGSKCLKIPDKFIDFKPTFELKETPLQEVSEIIVNDAESGNYREPTNLKPDNDTRPVSSKEDVHESVNSSEVGSSELNKNNQQSKPEEKRSNDTFDEIIERMRQCIIEKRKDNNELDSRSSTKRSSQSSQATLGENGSKHENEDPKSTSSNK